MANEPAHGINAATDYAAERGQSEIETLRRQVKELTDKYGNAAQHTFSDVQHTYSDVKQSVRDNIGEVEHQIRDKPVQSAIIAAGVGFLIGALVSR